MLKKIIFIFLTLVYIIAIYPNNYDEKENIIKSIDSIYHSAKLEKRNADLAQYISKFQIKGKYIETIIACNTLINNFEKQKKITEKDQKFLNAIRIALAQSYIGIGLYSKSIKYATASYIFAKKKKDTAHILSSLMLLSEGYSDFKNFKKAKKNMLKALQLVSHTSDIENYKMVLGNTASMYLQLNEPDSALIFLKKLEILEKNKKTKTYLYLNKCACYYDLKILDSALYNCKIFESSLNRFKSNHPRLTLNTLFAKIYFDLNKTEKGKLYFDKAVEIAKKNKYDLDLVDLYKLRIDILKKQKKYNEAALYSDNYFNLKDSLIDLNMKTAIKNVELLYDIQTKNNKYSLLKSRDKLKQTKISILSIFLIISLLVAYAFNKQRKKTLKAYQNIVKENIKNIDSQSDYIFKKSLRNNTSTYVLKHEKTSVKYEDNTINKIVAEKIKDSVKIEFEQNKIYLDKNLNLGSLAKKLNTNKVYLSYVFNTILNISFSEMINTYRINEAKKMLLKDTKKYTIEAIANECGFSNKATFNRNFKKITGVTPSTFIELSLDFVQD